LGEIRLPQVVDWSFVPDGNLSWSWDLNRHKYLLTLGTAYHYTRNAKYSDKIVELWNSWMRSNPPGRGLNWRSPFEVAARLRNWVWAYFLLATTPDCDQEFVWRTWQGLQEHARFLARHLEYHWPNNHLLLESLSLCEFAVVFREFGGERYLAKAEAILEAQVEEQVLWDGVHSELCPMYHEIVASELNTFVRLCERVGFPLNWKMRERIDSMRRFSAAMRREDGSFPLLGESAFSDTCLRFDEFAGDLVHWVGTGTSERNSSSALDLQLFPEGGYGILRGGTVRGHVVFDFGSWSRCASGNHGHSDALSFEYHAEGVPWIVDSGFFHPWQGDELAWGSYFRGTAAHNTLVVAGQEQFEFSAGGDIGRKSKTRLVSYRSSDDEVSVCGELEPYWSDGQVTHRREVALPRSGEFIIRDSVLVSGCSNSPKHRLQWLFHFVPDLRVEIPEPGMFTARSKSKELTCDVLCDALNLRLRLIRGQESPRQGWVARSSATVVPAWVVAVEAESSISCEVTFLFRIGALHTESADEELAATVGVEG